MRGGCARWDGLWRRWVRLLAVVALLPVLCDGRAGSVGAPPPRPEDGSRRSFSGSVVLPDLLGQLHSMLLEPFEVLDLSLPMVSLGLLDLQDVSKTPLLRQWLYNHIVSSGTDSTENGGDSAQTMIYVGLDDGRFLGYYGPEGRSAYTLRAASGESADTDWAPYSTLAAVNECVLAGQNCRDLTDGREVATACAPDHPRDVLRACTTAHCLVATTSRPETLAQDVVACAALGSAYTWQVGTCCTASCCDGDIRGYYSTSIAAVGQPTRFVAWTAYDHRARPWYVEAKQAWLANSSLSTGWSSVYEFSTNSAIGITALGVAARDGIFRGVFAIDYELGGINALFNRSLARSGVQETGWAYLVERANGKLLGATSGDTLYDNALAGSFTDKRLDAVACTHNSVAESASFLAEHGWPQLFHRRHQQWEFQSRIVHGPRNQLDWLLVVGQDTKCSTEAEAWNSLAGRCEICRSGNEPSVNAGIDECVECTAGRAGSNGQCVQCPDGKMPTDDRSACASCTGDRVGVGGSCERSCLFFVLPNEAKDGCKFWPSKASLLLAALLSAALLWCAAYKYHRAKELRAMDLGRYKIDLGPPIHKSPSCQCVFAVDFLRQKRRVCLKKVTDLEQFKKEIDARFVSSGQMLDRTAVVEVVAWHTPQGQDIQAPDGTQTQEIQRTPAGARYPYVLVMEEGERSLQDAVARERIAGFQLVEIRQIMRCVAKCLQKLHDGGVCHVDLKQKNVIQLRDSHVSGRGNWVLCDMDAATRIGSELDPRAKFSTAYSPPELACYKFANGPPVVVCPSFDVWSFGIVLFEMCSGQHLFDMDISNDNLINRNDQVRLCTWFCVDTEQTRTELLRKGVITRDSHTHRTMSDEELQPIFDISAKELVAGFGPELATELERRQVIEDAKDLVRWCLNGRASARPSLAEILDHPFLKLQTSAKTGQSYATDIRVAKSDNLHRSAGTRRSLADDITPARPAQFFAFLSHAQQDSSGLVNALYYAFAQLGLYNWIDMRQAEITLQGMRDGVANSNVFMLTLSERVLSSWYCQQEILCAIEYDKPFQIIVEVEPRFHPFDLKSWKASRSGGVNQLDRSDSHSGRQYSVKNHTGEVEMHTVSVARDPNDSWQSQHSDETLTKLVCDKIDEALSQAVAFRRRDFEQQAMIEELCRRNGVCLPGASETAYFPAKNNGTARVDAQAASQHVIFVIYNEDTAQNVVDDLQAGLDECSFQECARLSFCSQEHLHRWSSEIDTAHKVLLVLSAGVLDKRCLVMQLEQVLLTDMGDSGRDRVIMLRGEGWTFGSESLVGAPPMVRSCIESHEALSFRPRDVTGADWLRHEFPAMMTRLLDMLELIDLADDELRKSNNSPDVVRGRCNSTRNSLSVVHAMRSPAAGPTKSPALFRPSGFSERNLETISAPTTSSDVGNAGADNAASCDNDASFLLPGSALRNTTTSQQ